MNKPNVAKMWKDLKFVINKHSPEILTGIGIAGMISTTILAVRATPKALELIEDEKRRQNREIVKEACRDGHDCCPQITKLKPLEVVKVAWKPYIPAAVTGVASVGCLIGASSVSARRNAALAAAYNLSQTALTEYKDKVVEVIGEKKEKAIKDEIAKDKIEKNPVKQSDIIITGKGKTRFLDVFSGQRFESDIEVIKKAENIINRKLISDMYASLNDFYDLIGPELEQTRLGEDLGWNIDVGYIEIEFSAQIDDDGVPCIVLDYNVAPIYDYYKLNK